ncbi:hypothetical protein KEJ28_04810, partial [Candidatus Bathyarchaeota archaeon]|nr:hypothetical protein [Candidatus Bathyarchaeota archaeon]
IKINWCRAMRAQIDLIERGGLSWGRGNPRICFIVNYCGWLCEGCSVGVLDKIGEKYIKSEYTIHIEYA